MIIRVDLQVATTCKHPLANAIKKWIVATLKKLKQPGEISVRLVDEAEMTALNFQYRQKQKPTNVLSFPCKLPSTIRGDLLGDIVICAPIIEKEAMEQHKPLQAHWAHMLIHGVLHLCGFDHENEEEATKMESLETAILKDLNFPDPYKVETVYE